MSRPSGGNVGKNGNIDGAASFVKFPFGIFGDPIFVADYSDSAIRKGPLLPPSPMIPRVQVALVSYHMHIHTTSPAASNL